MISLRSNYSDALDGILKHSDTFDTSSREKINEKLLQDLESTILQLSNCQVGAEGDLKTRDDIDMVSEKVSLSPPLKSQKYEISSEESTDVSGVSDSVLGELMAQKDQGNILNSITRADEGTLGLQLNPSDSLDEEIEVHKRCHLFFNQAHLLLELQELEIEEQRMRQSFGLKPEDNITRLYLDRSLLTQSPASDLNTAAWKDFREIFKE